MKKSLWLAKAGMFTRFLLFAGMLLSLAPTSFAQDAPQHPVLTGFTVGNRDGDVWGRPVGIAVAPDGSLFVSDDGSRSIWHVIYVGK